VDECKPRPAGLTELLALLPAAGGEDWAGAGVRAGVSEAWGGPGAEVEAGVGPASHRAPRHPTYIFDPRFLRVKRHPFIARHVIQSVLSPRFLE